MQLKRFSFEANFLSKIDATVTFPTQKLSLMEFSDSEASPHSSQQKAMLEYELYGVTNHLSLTTSGGHYTAHLQSDECKDAWILCDDSILRITTQVDVETNRAYLLFYRKKTLSSHNIINLTYQSFG